jgi:group I intron endonuclease
VTQHTHKGKATLVYAAVCLSNGKLYFGITSRSLARRRSAHLADKSRARFHQALRKHTPSNFIWVEIIRTETWEEACKCESFLIAFYQTTEHTYGYNGTLGGDGSVGYRHTLEARQSMRSKRVGKSTWSKGVKMTADQLKSRLGNQNHLGKKHSVETKQRMSALAKRLKTPAHTIRVVLQEESVLGVSAVARKFGVSRSSVYKWKAMCDATLFV